MRRVKLMLDPNGSALGKDLPPEALARMSEEEKKEYEAEEIMRGIGNKCLRKSIESLAMAAFVMVVLYYSGGLNYILFKLNPHLFEAPIEGYQPRLDSSEL